MPNVDATKSDDASVGVQDSPSTEELTTLEIIESKLKEMIEAEKDPDRARYVMKPVEDMMKFRRMTRRYFS